MLKKTFIIATLFQAAAFFGQQYGGMWIPTEINEKEMKSLGMKIKAQDIWNTEKPSIKDAVVQFDGGCTAEIISPKGLLLTNHHCGYDNIQSHSTVENDLLTNGFWAKNMEEELPNPGVTVDFVTDIKEITQDILGNTSSLSGAELTKKINENIDAYKKSQKIESYQSIIVRPMFAGNKYYAFVVETYKDIRLVGAPPQSIGKFGSDTDNWVWPRHTGDFSMFRIYADKNNKPAEYSKDNVPFTPKHFLPISVKDIKENDFTFVFGFPGRTNEYLPSVAIEKIITDTNPARIEVRDIALKTLDEKMRADDATRIKYASKYASVANYWKKWIGETKGLKKSNAVAIKKDFEKKFQERVNKAGKQAEYGTILADFEKNYKDIKEYAIARDYFTEVVLRNSEILSFGYRLYQLEQVYNTRGEQAFNDRKNNLISGFEGLYKDYSAQVDEKVFEQLINLYATKSPKQFLPESLNNVNASALTTSVFGSSKLTSFNGLKELLNGDAKSVLEKLNQDKGYQLVKSIADSYQKNVAPKFDEINLKNIALQRTYMKGIMEFFPNDRIFPDANSTLRVTYGKVKGYKPSDAVIYEPVSYLDGVIEKYIPGDYEFDVPKKLIDLYNAKDYGRYADKNGKMPLAFIATNHTTGGNSGSPALDAKGNLIGLNFDRVWEGTMSDIYYSPEICRNIMVDARYILFVIDKFAGAKNLIEEMTIVYPKSQKAK